MAQIDLHRLDVHHRSVERIGTKLVCLTLEDEGAEIVLFFGGDPAAAHERLKRLRDELDEVARVLLDQIDPTDHEPVDDGPGDTDPHLVNAIHAAFSGSPLVDRSGLAR